MNPSYSIASIIYFVHYMSQGQIQEFTMGGGGGGMPPGNVFMLRQLLVQSEEQFAQRQ